MKTKSTVKKYVLNIEGNEFEASVQEKMVKSLSLMDKIFD
jgi:hypothetical protein